MVRAATATVVVVAVMVTTMGAAVDVEAQGRIHPWPIRRSDQSTAASGGGECPRGLPAEHHCQTLLPLIGRVLCSLDRVSDEGGTRGAGSE